MANLPYNVATPVVSNLLVHPTLSEALADAATPEEGLQNKWPFGAEKTTYPVYSLTVRFGRRGVHHMNQEVGLDGFLQCGAEGGQHDASGMLRLRGPQ